MVFTIFSSNIVKQEEAKNDKKLKIKERITNKLNAAEAEHSEDSDKDANKIKVNNIF